MEVSGEVADLMIKEGLEAAKIAAELSTKGLVNVAALLAAMVKQNYKVVGKVGIERLMKDGNAESVIIPIKAADYEKFQKIAKQFGVLYNAYVSGVHNYYCYATHISKDMRKIALGITRTMKNRLRERLQLTGDTLPDYIANRYGKSKQLRYVSGQALIPIGYIQARAPHYKRRTVNQYTEAGRESIHKNLEDVNLTILHYLMRNPVQFASVEFNNNRLALYCAQHGRCAVTKLPLEMDDIHCHHKQPREKGGNDSYGNLVLVSEAIHTLIHATESDVIAHYVKILRLNLKQKEKLNTLRKAAELPSI